MPDGGAIAIGQKVGARLSATDTSFIGCQAYSLGGAILSSVNVTLTRCVIAGCSVVFNACWGLPYGAAQFYGYGGGVALQHVADTAVGRYEGGWLTLDATDCVFRDNFAKGGGAVAGSFGTHLKALRTRFERNRALQPPSRQCGGEGGAIFLQSVKASSPRFAVPEDTHPGTMLFEECELASNEAEDQGGALTTGNHDVEVYMRRTIVRDNWARNVGGGLHSGSAELVMESSEFLRNSAGQEAGGIFLLASKATMTNTVISGSVARDGFSMSVGPSSSVTYVLPTCVTSEPSDPQPPRLARPPGCRSTELPSHCVLTGHWVATSKALRYARHGIARGQLRRAIEGCSATSRTAISTATRDATPSTCHRGQCSTRRSPSSALPALLATRPRQFGR